MQLENSLGKAEFQRQISRRRSELSESHSESDQPPRIMASPERSLSRCAAIENLLFLYRPRPGTGFLGGSKGRARRPAWRRTAACGVAASRTVPSRPTAPPPPPPSSSPPATKSSSKSKRPKPARYTWDDSFTSSQERLYCSLSRPTGYIIWEYQRRALKRERERERVREWESERVREWESERERESGRGRSAAARAARAARARTAQDGEQYQDDGEDGGPEDHLEQVVLQPVEGALGPAAASDGVGAHQPVGPVVRSGAVAAVGAVVGQQRTRDDVAHADLRGRRRQAAQEADQTEDERALRHGRSRTVYSLLQSYAVDRLVLGRPLVGRGPMVDLFFHIRADATSADQWSKRSEKQCRTNERRPKGKSHNAKCPIRRGSIASLFVCLLFYLVLPGFIYLDLVYHTFT